MVEERVRREYTQPKIVCVRSFMLNTGIYGLITAFWQGWQITFAFSGFQTRADVQDAGHILVKG
jgi:hypothetical protein